MSNLFEFLLLRGVDGNRMRLMETEKIDCDAILGMTDQQLKHYIPAYGDRVATMAFCHREKSTNTSEDFHSTLQKIRLKNSCKPSMKGNRNAKKLQRRVELGWKQYNFITKDFKQVRTSRGGGIRHLLIDTDTKLSEVMKFGSELFFPDGQSTYGNVIEFDISLHDFQGNAAKLEKTVAESYEESKLKLLRLYLYTMKKCPVTDEVEIENIPQEQISQEDISQEKLSGEEEVMEETSVLSSCMYVEAGTPTILMKKSPSQETSTSSKECDKSNDDFDVEILDPKLPNVSFKKRRCLNLKTSCPDSQLHSTSYIKDQSDSCELEDADMRAAIMASLEESGCSLSDILSNLASQIDIDGTSNLINVDRNDVLDGARRGFSRKKFNNKCKLNVKFSGEFGIDEGGPSREFMRLTLKAIRDSPIFEGDNNAKMLSPDMPSEERGDYYMFGKMIAYFLVHKGPAPNFLTPLMYNLIAGVPSCPQIEDVSDPEIRAQLNMIKDADDIRNLQLPDTAMHAIDYVGGIPLLSKNNKEKLLEALLHFYVVTRIKGVLSQFLDGLSCMGVLKAVREYPRTLSSLFTHQNHSTTPEKVEDMFEPVFSEEGSNQYVQELRTQSHWRDYIQDLDEKPGGIESLLQFVTGLDAAPALGFEPSPKLRFSHPDVDNPHDGTPYANTCANSLTIPVVHSYEVFCERMNMALSFGTFFTNG